MSMLGALAMGVAGGASAFAGQAQSDIEKNQKLDLAKQTADIQEQMQLRIADRAELRRQEGVIADSTGPVADAKLGYKARENEQANTAAVSQARSMIPVTQEALAASNKTMVENTKANAANAGYLSDIGKVKFADPEIAARIAAYKAAANSNNAEASVRGQQAEGLKLDIKDKVLLNGIYDNQMKILTDPSLTDEQRADKMKELDQRAIIIQKRGGKYQGAGQRDPELDTTTTETTKMDKSGNQIKTTSKAVRRPGDAATDGRPAEAEAMASAKAAIDAGAPADQVNARLAKWGYAKIDDGKKVIPTRRDPITNQDMSEQQWNKKFGNGDFKKLYAPGEDSLKAF